MPSALKTLGFGFRGLHKRKPISNVRITSVEADGWGDNMSVQVGDKVTAINGSRIEQMTSDSVFAAMASRPLKIRFRRKAQSLYEEQEFDSASSSSEDDVVSPVSVAKEPKIASEIEQPLHDDEYRLLLNVHRVKKGDRISDERLPVAI